MRSFDTAGGANIGTAFPAWLGRSRPPIALEPRCTFRGAEVVEVLERVGRQVRFPVTIRVDQGTEFVSRDLDLWAYQRDVTLAFSRPGKPTDNAFIEAFNGGFRAECLNTHWFLSLADAEKKLEDWPKYNNEERPRGANAMERYS
jgi:putative transposase